MRIRSIRNTVYWLSSKLVWVLGSIAALVAGLQKFKQDLVPEHATFLIPVIEAAKAQQWWLSPVIYIAAAGAAVVVKIVGKPWVWEMIHELLGDIRDTTATGDRTASELGYNHRATLFKRYSKWNIRCIVRYMFDGHFSDRLIAVERSGYLTRKAPASFRICNNGGVCEGFAGSAWISVGAISTDGITLQPPKAKRNKGAVKKYAGMTKTSEAWVRKRLRDKKPLAASFCAVRLEPGGRPWGVIVLDSAAHDAFEGFDATMDGFVGRTFSKLLNKV